MPIQESPNVVIHDPERAHHLLMLEFGDRRDFDDPKLEYRRLFSELLRTFMLVLVAAGGGILHAKGQISLAAAVVAPGLMVLAIILFMGAVSGAHLNPGVSLAFAVRGDFPWKRVPGYIIVQLLGATLACLFLLAVFGNVEHLGATLPGPGYKDWQALLMEIALTAVLLSVILGTASAAQNVGAARRARRRRVHRAGRPVVGACERHLDEPSPLVRTGAGERRLDGVLGVRRRSADRRCDRRRLRDDPPRPRRGPDLPRRGSGGAHAGTSGGEGEARRGDRRGEGGGTRTRSDEPRRGPSRVRSSDFGSQT